MKKLTILVLLIVISATAVFSQSVQITPKPLSAILGTGNFTFSNKMILLYPECPNDSVKTIAATFAADLKAVSKISLKLSSKVSKAAIQLVLDKNFQAEEYKLVVTKKNLIIRAARPAGFFYAFQTIRQLMPVELAALQTENKISTWTIPAITVSDKPRFPWRGFMLDEGRHFFGKEEVKRVIDIMATYKMNRFHWHLTEDQGWRIEIKQYPKLTTVGSVRKNSQIWGDPKGIYFDSVPYGPYFYTQDEIREVVAYAKSRFVEIIPEIEFPGHAKAALAAYPEYSCTPNAKHEVWTAYGVTSDVLNVGNPEAVTFVKNILDEVSALFPYEFIHIGGDECPTKAWQDNAQCQALLTSIGSTNYRDLQTYFFKDIETYLKNKANPSDRRRIIAWNETLGGDLTGSNVTIMAWINAANASKKAANLGLDVIMTPQVPYYINRKQSTDPNEPYSQGKGTETVELVYNHEPIPSDVTAAQLPFYKGIQANFWSEHVETASHLEYLMLPRIVAVAESGWTPSASKNFNDFITRIRKDAKFYDLKGWNYGKHFMEDPRE